MGKYDSLLDSIKFNAMADDFARVWRKRGITREEKEMRLEAMLDAAGTLLVGSQIPPAKVEIVAQHDIQETIPDRPEDRERDLQNRLDATAQLIQTALEKAQVGKNFVVNFPFGGQYQIDAIDSLVNAIGLKCVPGENRSARRIGDQMYMCVEFTRVG
jgi:protein tyrosine phosphatase (PTP) superfamily phosphohydrolase (DUF442 family)